MREQIFQAAKVSLILVYLVIIAGAVVRMTGSGMGCPDWPKCFGYYIPPTDIETLQWKPNRTFKKGQVIIVEESLFVANSDFVTQQNYNPINWSSYTKHTYAVFNVSHTWVEYINRLVGALAGLATLVLALFSLRHWSIDKKVPLFSWLVVLGMGFQAWLGATVVYSVLEPVKITLHMLMALVIVALLIYIIKILDKDWKSGTNQWIRLLVISTLFLTVIQIILGTQVRQFVDDQIQTYGESGKQFWLQDPTLQFYVHRTLSLLVLALNSYLFWIYKKQGLPLCMVNIIMLIILFEIASGIAMYYVHFPFGSQPLHLILASLLFGAQFYLLLQAFGIRGRHNSL